VPPREAPRTTQTKHGVAGDPLNVALVGTRAEVLAAFARAGWFPADPINLRSSAGIAASVALGVPYRRAPVSNLYLWGRRQDLAFERPCGHSARSRHHVRFWCAGVGADGRPFWLGAATFDASVGRSARTGLPTHHIDPDVDRERDTLLGHLRDAGVLASSSLIPWSGPARSLNGEGDCYFTDGNLAVGVLASPTGGACR
jgi:hypothetical protein